MASNRRTPQHDCLSKSVEDDSPRKPVRVWMDGSFDMLHFGHVAAMQQAKSLGDCLVVGAQSDADVIAHKGPPVYPEAERFRLLRAVSFIDEFVGAAKYGTSVETLDKHDCAFCVHGDDATLRASDTDVVKQLMAIDRAKLVSRGYGNSTTSQIKRILQRAEISEQKEKKDNAGRQKGNRYFYLPWFDDNLWCAPTFAQISAFRDGRIPQGGDNVVYVEGTFELFNVGHLSFLEQAAKEGDFLLVGVHSDYSAALKNNLEFPVLCLMERAMFLLSLKCVSDVIFGAPAALSDDFLDTFKIKTVCRGQLRSRTKTAEESPDRYAAAKRRGIYKEIDSGCEVTTQTIVERVLSRRAEYVARNKRKLQQEALAAKMLKADN